MVPFRVSNVQNPNKTTTQKNMTPYLKSSSPNKVSVYVAYFFDVWDTLC